MKINPSTRSILGIPLALYGYLLQKTWGAVEGADLSFSGVVINFGTTLTCILVALALSFIMRFANTVSARRVVLWSGVGIQLASAILDALILFTGTSNSALLVLSLILKAAGTISMSVLWIELYATRNPMQAGFLCAAATAVSALVLYIVEQASGPHLVALRIALTAFSALFYMLAWRDVQAHGNVPSAESQRFFVPWRAIVFVLAYSFSYGIASFMMNARMTNYAAIIPSIIVIVLILLNTKKFTSTSLSRIALPLMIGGFLLAAFASSEFAPVALLLLDTGYASMELLILLLVCAATYSANGSAAWLFGLLVSSEFLGSYAGRWLATSLDAHMGTSEFVVMEVFALVIVAAVSPLLASDRSLSEFWKGTAQADGAPAEDALKMRVQELAAKFGLTEREKEVLYLAAQGKTNAVIASDMVLSEGTIKTHLHHIYRKFDIRTRSELMKIVGK